MVLDNVFSLLFELKEGTETVINDGIRVGQVVLTTFVIELESIENSSDVLVTVGEVLVGERVDVH